MSGIWLQIAGMALVTYALRAGGLALGGRLPQTGPVRRVMNALPACLLIALITPELVAAGWVGLMGGAAVALIMILTRQTLPAFVAGVALVALLRSVS